ncbi:MAG: glycosyltransferase family 9 protein [Bacteroidales bacterium]
MQRSKRVLLLRFSAIGDVAMTLPVIYSMAEAYPDYNFTFVSQSFLGKLLVNKPSNLTFYPIDISKGEKSLMGVFSLFNRLYKMDFDMVIDLHDVLRTKVIRYLFSLRGVNCSVIDKGRSEKRALTSREGKVMEQLKSSVDRYKEAMNRAGFVFPLSFNSLFDKEKADLSKVESLFGKKSCRWIGLAPFAKHKGKIYPIERCSALIELLLKRDDIKILLFGGGAKELAVMKDLSEGRERVVVAGGSMDFYDELALMSELDLMISMDSANMHLASLVGTPVVSVWGATHPYAGFMGYGQSSDRAVQLDLPCRPCSVFGDKECYRGDFACMEQLPPESIERVVNKLLVVK